jgi:serine/threonine protein kinase
MEYCENGDLERFLVRNTCPLSQQLIWKIFIQLCLGIYHLHKINIIHRDLKPLNILLTDNYEKVKIADLGVACHIDNNRNNDEKSLKDSHHD